MWTIPQGINKMKALRMLRGKTCLENDSKATLEIGELEQLEVLDLQRGGSPRACSVHK